MQININFLLTYYCLHDYRKSLKVMLAKLETICKTQHNREACEKLNEIKSSLKNDVLSIEQYAWLFKFLHKIDI